MHFLLILLIIVVFVLLIFNIWNLVTIRQIKNDSKAKIKILDDPRYYELKFKIEFLVAAVSIIVAIAGILGYNSYESVKSQITLALVKKTDSIDLKLNTVGKDINNKDSSVRNISLRLDEVSKSIPISELKLKTTSVKLQQLEKNIDLINAKNIIKRNYYVVKGLCFNLNYS